MTRDKAKELLPIIQGFAEGREVEYFSEMKNKWLPSEDPVWFNDTAYRIKELPVYVPFDNQDIDALRGKWVKDINYGIEYMITRIRPNSSLPIYNGEWYSFEKLFRSFTFLDGTPCGKLKES